MSSQAPGEEQRRLSIGTLAVASIASAGAALITSQFWQGGTPIAAAVTPVIVALISEALHRPATRIAGGLTVERAALPAETNEPPPQTEPQVSVYRSRPDRRAALSLKVIAVTAALAFAIGVAVLTLPELIAGQSLGNSDRGTTILGGNGQNGSGQEGREGPSQDTEPRGERPPRDTTEETQPEMPPPQTTPEEEPSDPETTAPAPQPGKTPPRTTPAPETPAARSGQQPAP